jgi:hypothetical protein
MSRYLFMFLSALSLLLCLAAIVLWVQSYFISDLWFRDYDHWTQLSGMTHWDRTSRVVVASRGIIEVFIENFSWDYEDMPPDHPEGISMGHQRQVPDDISKPLLPNAVVNRMGFYYQSVHRSKKRLPELTSDGIAYNVRANRVIGMPLWFVCGVTGIGPLVWAIAWRRQRRRRTLDACAHCGYALTGNLSGRCPECGSPTSRER